MYSGATIFPKMESDASDMNGKCLLTDLVHELSPELEMPFLLGESLNSVDSVDNISPLESMFCEELEKDNWVEDTYYNFINTCNNSGSSSECSSSELWSTKIELDTPPITPPDESISSDNAFLLPSEELKFIPVNSNESLLTEVKDSKDYKSIKKTRIQPKPVSTTFNIIGSKRDSPSLDVRTVVCNVFSDLNSNHIKNQDDALKSKVFLNSRKTKLLTQKDLELQAKRKQERMIRNRESAYLSRKRKKEHVAQLEKLVQDLQAENKQLKLENSSLRQRLGKYENLEPSLERKPGNLFTDSPRKTTALLALLFTVCLNIGSFSSLIHERRIFKSENELVGENVVPNYHREIRHTRSLLWANNDLKNLNSTYSNLTKTSCPLLVNQTEFIRLESELRRWIGDDDYSKKAKHNVSEISQYFYLGEKFPHKKISKQKKRVPKANFQKKNLEMDMYQMNVLNYDTLFEAIHRRDDTFYLVSFSSNHLLLPALSHNQTSRPKMSLMLPAFFSNGTEADQVEMMQIDCEVTNTQLLSVNENDIPSHMRPYSNSTLRSKSETKSEAKEFEKYFVSEIPVRLVPAKKFNFKAKQNDVTSNNSSKNHKNFSSQNPKNISKSGDSGAFGLQQPQLNFTLFQSKNHKDKNSQFFKYKKNIFSYEIYKQDQNTVDFTSKNKKNLLKLLVVGPGATNSKAMKFNYEKLFHKPYRNMTKFLFN